MTAKTILIVDDEPAILMGFSKAFRIRGFEVLEADNQGDALALLYSQAPDYVLTDERMPKHPGEREVGFHGQEILRRARHLGKVAVLLSANPERVDMAKAQGFEALAKPARIQAVLAALGIPILV